MNNKNLRNIAFSRMFLFNDTSNNSKEEVTWKTTRPAEDVESEGNEPVPPAENPIPPNLSEHPETQSIPSGEISSIPTSHNFPVLPRGNVEKEREYDERVGMFVPEGPGVGLPVLTEKQERELGTGPAPGFPVFKDKDLDSEYHRREYARQLQYQDAYEKYNPQHKIKTGFTKDELASLGDDSKVDSYISEKYPTATNEQRAALRSIALQQRLSLERDSRSTSTTGLPRNLTDMAESGRRFVNSFVNATPRISSETQGSPRLNTSSLPRVTSSHFTPNTVQAQTPVQENSVNPYGSSSPVLNDKSTIAYFKGTKFNPSDFSFKTRKNNNGKIELLLDNDTLNGSKERREAILSAYNQLYSGKAVRDDNGNMWRLDAKGNIKQIVTRVEKPALNETKIEFDIPKIDFQGIRFDQDGNLKGFKEGWFKDDYQKQLSTVWNELRSGKVVEDLSGRKYKLDPKTNQVLFLNPSIDQQQPNITDVVENGVTPSLPPALGVTGTPTRMTNAQIQGDRNLPGWMKEAHSKNQEAVKFYKNPGYLDSNNPRIKENVRNIATIYGIPEKDVWEKMVSGKVDPEEAVRGEPSTVEGTPAAPTSMDDTASMPWDTPWKPDGSFNPIETEEDKKFEELISNIYGTGNSVGGIDYDLLRKINEKPEEAKKLIAATLGVDSSTTEGKKYVQEALDFAKKHFSGGQWRSLDDTIIEHFHDRRKTAYYNGKIESDYQEMLSKAKTPEEREAASNWLQKALFENNREAVKEEAIKASERTTYNLAKEMWPQGEEDLSQWWGRLSDDQKNGLLIGGGLGLLGFLMMAGKEDKDAFDWILTLGIPVVGIGGGAMYGSSKGAKPGVIDPRRLTQYMERKGYKS